MTIGKDLIEEWLFSCAIWIVLDVIFCMMTNKSEINLYRTIAIATAFFVINLIFKRAA